MARAKVDQYSTNPDANTDVGGINIGEGSLARDSNNAKRQLMAHIAATPLREDPADMRAALGVFSSAEVTAEIVALADQILFDTAALMLADVSLTYSNTTTGDYIRTRSEGFAYEVAASGASDHHITTGGGLKLYVSGNTISPEALGAVGGAFYAQDAEITSGSTSFVSASATFVPGDVGKVIAIQRAGATGTDTRPEHLVTTIAAYVSATNVTLADAAGNTVDSGDDDHWRSWGFGVDETDIWQKAVSSARPIVCASAKSYFVTEPLGTLSASLDMAGSTILGCYDDNDVVAATESIFYTTASNITVKNGISRWLGYFKKSYVSFLRAIAPALVVDNIEASGFSGAGVYLGTTGDPLGVYAAAKNKIENCWLHHSRVAGLSFGNTKELVVIGSKFHFNGLSGDGGTGYGLAGLAGSTPLDTVVSGNCCNDNYRKGIDFHGGINTIVTGNVCKRNKVFGIYVEDTAITNSVVISKNIVSEMEWTGTISSGVSGEGSSATMYGIVVGAQTGQGLSALPTNILIEGNIVEDFAQTSAFSYPIYIFGSGLSYGDVKIHGNIVLAGDVTSIIGSNNTLGSNNGNWYDVSIQGNTLAATSCSTIPVYIRSASNRKKIFSNNIISVTTNADASIFNWDTTTVAGRSAVVSGNAVDYGVAITTGEWARGSADARALLFQNIVNGAPDRDWDGKRYEITGVAAAPTTRSWVAGSIAHLAAPAAGGTPGYVCTTAGSPGTWKAMANLAA